MVICQFVKSMQIQIQSIALGAKPAENVSLKVKVFFENASCKLSNFHKIPVQSIFQKFQIKDYKMKAKEMLHHLEAISKEETSCTLITSLGERVEVKYPAETNFEKLNKKFSKKIFHLEYFQKQYSSPIFPGAIFISNISRCNPSCWLPSAHSWHPYSPRYCLRILLPFHRLVAPFLYLLSFLV